MAQDFSDRTLQGRDFKNLDLTGANFSNADIRGANFTGAVLRNANFSRAIAGLQPFYRNYLVILAFCVLVALGFIAAASGAYAVERLTSDILNEKFQHFLAGSIALIIVTIFAVISLITVNSYHQHQEIIDEIAQRISLFLGDRYSILQPLYSRIKSRTSMGGSFTFKLSNKSKEEIDNCTRFCQLLDNHSFLKVILIIAMTTS